MRELTGSTRIRVRAPRPELTGDTRIRLSQVKGLKEWIADKHSNYKIGETAEWKDGLHQKTAHGWVKVPEERDKYSDPVGEVKNLDKLTEKYFLRPNSSLKLPSINSATWQETMHDDRKVLLKKFVVDRMKKTHPEIKSEGLNHRDVLLNALYNCDKVMHCKPQDYPYYYTTVKKSNGGTPIKIETKNCVAVLDVSPENKYIEVVDWRWIGKKGMRSMENQERKNNVQ